MGAGGFVEPLVVVLLFVGGTWINRYQGMSLADRPRRSFDHFTPGSCAPTDSESGGLLGEGEDERRASDHRSPSPSLLVSQEPHWRTRELRLWGFKSTVRSPNTTTFRGRALSRLLERFPFLVECWYWLLVYWTYQLGRAFTAVTLQQSTVHTARRHALQVVHLEQGLRIFSELEIQAFFMQYHTLMLWINRIYSFIHIPGTIFFLIWLYYYTITRNRLQGRQSNKDIAKVDGSPGGPGLYEARRRTMAVCNLLAFIVFTLWPCMPPRLLSEPTAEGPDVTEAQKYGFVDTVHGEGGESSVWTQNRFCNQYAAMPSLHFGYSLMIGLTVIMIPLSPEHRQPKSTLIPSSGFDRYSLSRIRLPSWPRLLCVLLGFLYPFTILIAIIATANHFILDAVAGAIVCGLGWWWNRSLLNLLPLEDYLLWCLRVHKPGREVMDVVAAESDDTFVRKGVILR